MVPKQVARAFRFFGSKPARLSACAVAALVFVACDSSLLSEGPSASCTEPGAQCQLPDGPLGVCERSRCPDDATPPCFQCTSQH